MKYFIISVNEEIGELEIYKKHYVSSHMIKNQSVEYFKTISDNIIIKYRNLPETVVLKNGNPELHLADPPTSAMIRFNSAAQV